MPSPSSNSFVAGLTPRSLLASLFCMLLAGIYTQHSEVILVEGQAVAERVLPVPAIAVLLLLVGLSGGVYALARVRLLSRAELFCVLFSMLISIPLMTQGMWHRFVGLIAAPVRTASFAYLDAYNDNLWPHGDNLLADAFREGRVELAGPGTLAWERLEFMPGRRARLPRLSNGGAEGQTRLVVRLPVARHGEGASGLVPARPHLLGVLARSEETGPESQIFCRAYADEAAEGNELFAARRADRRTFIHQQGFERLGRYGISFPETCREHLRLEFGLDGRGSVVFADPRLLSVAALEGMYRGRKLIGQSEYDRLPEAERPADALIRPDRLFSLAGARFLLAGYIPLREWVRPAIAWSSFILLLTSAFFAVNVIMRRQWAESERYPFPNARIPFALIGGDEEGLGAFAEVWHNRLFWAGLATAMAWGLLKGAHAYNSKVPNLDISVDLGPYFQDPGWGGMWNVTFTVTIFALAVASFFELNVLLSLVLGFWLYRSLFWLGQATDLRVNAGFPWRYEQAVGSYLGYFLIVLFFSRKYLWRTLREAVRGGRNEPAEVLSSRAAVGLLLACLAGAMAWAAWLEVSQATILVYFGFLLVVGFVAAKLRAECGLIGGYFTPYNAMLALSMLGGMSTFGAGGMLTALILSGFLTVSVFFFIPGAQLELIQLGRRLRIQPRHLAGTALLGVLGGLFIGGWVFLANAYALGGDSIKYQWAFDQAWFFGSYKSELANTTTAWLQAAEAPTAGPGWALRAMLASGGAAMLLTTLRQFVAGLWFHPIGIVLASSHLLEGAWGSLLAAWGIRALALKLGGPTCVRHKLQPFFVGALVGAVLVAVIFLFINQFSAAAGSPNMYRKMT